MPRLDPARLGLPHDGLCAICDTSAFVYPLWVGTGTAWLCLRCKLTTVAGPRTRPVHDNDPAHDKED